MSAISYCSDLRCANVAPCAHHSKVKNIVIGYHMIRGLAAPLRMMCFYKEQNCTMKYYGADMRATWFGADKPALILKNSCLNLPYIINGDEVVTQSNTCALYLGKLFGIDDEENFVANHTVLDQVMDLRNDLMKVVYPFGSVKTKEEFPEAAKAHIAGSATTTFTKLEAYMQGHPFMRGVTPQSGDFMLFEMLDQHLSICAKIGEANVLDLFPKLKQLHATMLQLPTLAKYFNSAMHVKWPQNNGLFTHFTGLGDDFVYGASGEESFTF